MADPANIEGLQEGRRRLARHAEKETAIWQCLHALDRKEASLKLSYVEKIQRLQAALTQELQTLESEQDHGTL